MRKTLKKGFTLTELIIVIVIIAILLAIFIPLLTTYTKKARIVTEKEIVRNLNIALKNDEETILSGEKHKTMYDALKIAELNGYSVEKINNTKTGNEILWDSKNDVFCYLNGEDIEYIPEYPGTNPVGPKEQFMFWRIADEYNNAKGYSVYLAGTDKTGSYLNITTGLDVGENTGVTEISYVRTTGEKQEGVVIRTHSYETDLTINAPADTVKHYGEVGSLTIVAIAGASYHENGKVAFAEIKTGRIVLETQAEVSHIHLTATGEGNAAYFDNITVAKASSVEMPDFSRDPVEIPTAGKLVVALQDGTDKDDTKEYVWLTAVGVYEQVTVSDSKTDAKNNYVATSNTTSQEQKTAAQQIANNITFTASGEDYKVAAKTTDGGATWTYEVVDKEGNKSNDYTADKHATANTVEVKTNAETPVVVETTKENGVSSQEKSALKEENKSAFIVNITASVESLGDGESFQFVSTGSNLVWSSSDADVATISQNGLLTANGVGQTTVTVTDGEQVKTCDVTINYFHNGEGSESDPFIIANRKQLLNTGLFYNQSSYYFKVMDGVNEIDCSNWEIISYFGGTLDGNGVTLTNLDAPLIECIKDNLSNSTATIKNLNINCNMYYNDDRGAIITYSKVKNTVFDNVNVHGLIESSLGCSPYIGYGCYGYNYYYFNNCVSNVSLVATGGSASGFVNHPSYSEAEGANPSVNVKIFITDSLYNGNMSAATSSGFKFKYFVVNSNGLAVTTKYSDEFIAQYGNPEGTLYAAPNGSTANGDGSKTFNAGNYGSNLVDYYTLSDNKAVLSTLTVATPAKGEAFGINKLANAAKIIITLEIGANDENGYGNYVGTYEIEEINVSSVATGSSVSSNSILNFHVVVVPANNTDKTTGADGSTYYVVSGRNGSTYGSAVVRITQYDIYGNVLGTKDISIAE